MTKTCALIVGLEKYDTSAWNVEGPCDTAIAMAKWLLKTRPDAMLRVVLYAERDLAFAESELPGVHIEYYGSRAELWDAATKWPDIEGTADFFVYWAGHGGTDLRGTDRHFICSDLEGPDEPRTVNCSELARRWHQPRFISFPRQIVLAEICGTPKEVNTIDQSATPRRLADQAIFYASPSDQTATSGEFSGIALGVLEALGEDAFDPGKLRPALEKACEAANQPFDLHAIKRDGTTSQSFGAVDAQRACFEEVRKLIATLDVPPDALERHYTKIVTESGNGGLGEVLRKERAERRLAMLGQLSSLNRDAAGHYPYYLLKFLLRVARESDDAEKLIGTWLKTKAGQQKAMCEAIKQDLDEETDQRFLLVVIAKDPTSSVLFCDFRRCGYDGSFDPAFDARHYAAKGGEDLERTLTAAFAALVGEGVQALENLHVHFLVDPHYFGFPFHNIQVPDAAGLGSCALGERCPVVIRSRTRILSRDRDWRKAWEGTLERIRSCRLDELCWSQLCADAPQIDDVAALWYADFAVSMAAQGGADIVKLKALYKLLQCGAPLIYIPHVSLANVDQTLKSNSAARNIDGFVEAFHRSRISGAPYANHAALLWDDPQINPFVSRRGASDK